MNMEERKEQAAIYQSPVLRVVEFANCDVITASGDNPDEVGAKFLDGWTFD